MKNENEKIVEICWEGDSPVYYLKYFEIDHTEGKIDRIKYRKKLRKNWTDYIIEIDEWEPEQICGYCGSEDIGPYGKKDTMCYCCNAVFRNEDIGSFVA